MIDAHIHTGLSIFRGMAQEIDQMLKRYGKRSIPFLDEVKRADPRVFPAWLSLWLATIESARAIGLDHEIGSLKKGKKAGIIIVNLQESSLCPIYTDPPSASPSAPVKISRPPKAMCTG